ncbi:hypothetical protein P4B35_20780 [Pontiellaceae bacterium B12227]|nr:hypothetical protein [Pontiellaceae bacterium B12227]
MIIEKILHKDYHDPIYGSLDWHPDIKAKLDNPPPFITKMIGYRKTNARMRNLGLRVAAISAKRLQYLTKYESNEELTRILIKNGQENLLAEMKKCPPAGARTDLVNHHQCEKYAACPWCRFRTAVKIGKALGNKLNHSGGIAVTRISQPETFQGQFDNHKDAYSKLIRGICVTKKPKLFLCDVAVTVPNWYQNYFHQYSRHAAEKEWVFSKDTTIIGILPKGSGPLPLPEEMVSEAARESMGFCGDSNWRIYTPSTLHLQYAIGYAMRVAPALLSPNIDPAQYAECINMQANYRVAPHGGITISAPQAPEDGFRPPD